MSAFDDVGLNLFDGTTSVSIFKITEKSAELATELPAAALQLLSDDPNRGFLQVMGVFVNVNCTEVLNREK